MDYSPIVSVVLSTFWWMIPLAILAGIAGSPIVKGYVGELLVRLVARLRLDKTTYHGVDNMTLPTPDGTTQIDHVVLSRYGVFVLETKRLSYVWCGQGV